ncbi:hypothetical protein BCON_0051g00300 [Botryotinia convoluta]|uniref:Uncharacterized protein n=1 Tax=Botryotinia convoluta TaxID=54673 RepID=A0A4Z1IHY7_9HELO|nr:hypothetical protein BCON_0051g00300 [Botryotinia convoluta]
MESRRLGPHFCAVAFLTLGPRGTVSSSSIHTRANGYYVRIIFNAMELPECPDADSSRQDDFYGG